MVRRIVFLALLALVVACSDDAGGASGSGGSIGGSGGAGGASGGSAGTGGVQNTPIEITESSFDCITDGTKVRKFFVKNLLGDLDGSLAVANGDAPLPYPAGTLLQLVPQEAMVKREAGFSPATGDWEFFFLQVSDGGTTIADRGSQDVLNAFDLNCATCHADAADNDYVCETDNGCVPLTISDELIDSLQQGDPRCD